MRTFEKYLEEDVWEPEGILDDDMPDAFEAWLEGLDTNDVLEYAEDYGKYCFSKGNFERQKVAIKEI